MKANYIKPESDITVLTLEGSVLVDGPGFDIGGQSGGGTTNPNPANEMNFDENDLMETVSTRSLWDE